MSKVNGINNAAIKALEAKAEAASKVLSEPEKALVLAFAAGVAAGANSAAHIKQQLIMKGESGNAQDEI